MPSGAFPSSILFYTLPVASKAIYIHHFWSEGKKEKREGKSENTRKHMNQ